MHNLQKKDLVDISIFCPHIILDIRYATKNNLTGKQLYKKPLCFLHKKVANALKNVQTKLEKNGLGLKIWDAYRPMSIQNKLMEFVNNTKYAASISNHSKGIAVDVTLIDFQTKKELKMPTEFDDFTKKAYADYSNLNNKALSNRDKLKNIMTEHNFTVYSYEWWHYDFLKLKTLEPLDIEI